MTRRRDLSRLSGLLTVAAEAGQAVPTSNTLPIQALKPGAGQPRREFDSAKLSQLAQSLKEQGILQPLLVRPVDQGYEIVAGERRWRAAQLAGLQEVPVIIRTLSDHEARQLALIENLQRENLNAVDEVDAKLDLVALTLDIPRQEARSRLMQLLREDPSSDHELLETLFGSLGETWQYFAKNKVRILNWPASILDAVRGGLPFTLGGTVAAAPAELQEALLAQALSGASREELRRQIKLAQENQSREEAIALTDVGRMLGSKKWLAELSPTQQKAVQDWIKKMPGFLRQKL